jgi:general secretion pathway protein A
MYAGYFGLKQAPFSIAPDPHYLYMSERHREALAHLLYGIEGGGGFVLLSGEIGAGKTTICRCFLEQIPDHCNVAYIFNPKLTVSDLLKSICHEFRVDVKHEGVGPATIKDHLDPLNDYLLRSHAAGQHNILIIDEAQNLTSYVLEQLRLLTNLETPERKLLQIILIGQPELRQMLARPELEQLAQRVIARFHLGTLSESECREYIYHRMGVAGLNGPLPFSDAALRRIHALTRGVPRRINLLCDRSLLGAYASQQRRVERDVVDKAAREVFESADFHKPDASSISGKLRGLRTLALGALGGAGSAAALFGLWLALQPKVPTAIANGSTPVVATATAPGKVATPPDPSTASDTSLEESPPAAAAPSLPLGPPPAKALFRSEVDALRELGPFWNQKLTGSDPCATAQRAELQCFRVTRMTLHGMRELDRPAILLLRIPGERSGRILLTGMTPETATLTAGDQSWVMPLTALADIWRGEYTTLWQTPPGQTGRLTDGSTGPAAEWLHKQLDQMQTAGKIPPTLSGLREKITAYQLSKGLSPDGDATPMTFMMINREVGVEEPRLSPSTP